MTSNDAQVPTADPAGMDLSQSSERGMLIGRMQWAGVAIERAMLAIERGNEAEAALMLSNGLKLIQRTLAKAEAADTERLNNVVRPFRKKAK